jgi:hypothetical protein
VVEKNSAAAIAKQSKTERTCRMKTKEEIIARINILAEEIDSCDARFY